MIRIGGLVVIIRMAAKTLIWGIDVAALMAGKAIGCNGRMCALQRVVIVVDRKVAGCQPGFVV